MKIARKLGRFLEELRIRRLERRGDLVRGTEQFWDIIPSLAHDLIPEPEREIARDLFIILAAVWAVRAEKGVPHNSYDILRHVRDRAWLGYVDTPALTRRIQSDLPRAKIAQRMALYFEEITAKQSTYLFLPAVSRIERHQAGHPPPISLQLDKAQGAFGHTSVSDIAQMAFALAPQHTRERDAFLVALMGATWGKGTRATDLKLLADVVEQLRLLYEHPNAALIAVRAAAYTNAGAAQIIEMAEQVSAADRPLWLETLFIAENWRSGPQHFAHALEVRGGRIQDLLRQ